MSESSMDFSYVYLFGFSSAVNWPFYKFALVPEIYSVETRSFHLPGRVLAFPLSTDVEFPLPRVHGHLRGRGVKGPCGPALTPSPEPEQREQNT